MNVKFPYGFDSTGSTAQDNLACHIRDMVEQILLTSPGERVNLPEFGCGVQQLIFAPNSDTLRTSTQFLIFNSLQRWLGDRIDLSQVSVTSEQGDEEAVTIEVVYVVKATQQRLSLQVQV